jgi:hypothetical protein
MENESSCRITKEIGKYQCGQIAAWKLASFSVKLFNGEFGALDGFFGLDGFDRG